MATSKKKKAALTAQKTVTSAFIAATIAGGLSIAPAHAVALPATSVTGVTVDDSTTNGDNILGTTEVVNATFNFSVPNGSHAGDTLLIDLPQGYYFNYVGTLDITDPATKNVIAQAKINGGVADGQTLITLTKAVEGMLDVKGSFTAPVKLSGNFLPASWNFDDPVPLTYAINGGNPVDTGKAYKAPKAVAYSTSTALYTSANASRPGTQLISGSASSGLSKTTGDVLVTLKAGDNWNFPSNLSWNAYIDNDPNVSSNGGTTRMWETVYKDHATIVSQTAKEVVIRVTGVPAGYAARVSFGNGVGAIDGKDYVLTATVDGNSDIPRDNVAMTATAKPVNITGAAGGEAIAPAMKVKALVGGQDANDAASALKLTADITTNVATAPVTVPITNTGNVPLIDPVINGSDGSEKVLEGVTIPVGQSYTADLGTKTYKVGAQTVTYTVTANGVKATDPINVNVVESYKIAASVKNQIQDATGAWIDADSAAAQVVFNTPGEHATRLVLHNPTTQDITIKSYVNNLGATVTDGKTVAAAGKDAILDGGKVTVDTANFTKTATVTASHGAQEVTVKDPIFASMIPVTDVPDDAPNFTLPVGQVFTLKILAGAVDSKDVVHPADDEKTALVVSDPTNAKIQLDISALGTGKQTGLKVVEDGGKDVKIISTDIDAQGKQTVTIDSGELAIGMNKKTYTVTSDQVKTVEDAAAQINSVFINVVPETGTVTPPVEEEKPSVLVPSNPPVEEEKPSVLVPSNPPVEEEKPSVLVPSNPPVEEKPELVIETPKPTATPVESKPVASTSESATVVETNDYKSRGNTGHSLQSANKQQNNVGLITAGVLTLLVGAIVVAASVVSRRKATEK